jgi:hypothetical protein
MTLAMLGSRAVDRGDDVESFVENTQDTDYRMNVLPDGVASARSTAPNQFGKRRKISDRLSYRTRRYLVFDRCISS